MARQGSDFFDFALGLLLSLSCSCRSGVALPPPPAESGVEREAGPWSLLFDGQSLHGWKEVFGNEGLAHIVDGELVLEMGTPLSGVTWQGELPRSGYELELSAARLAGTDFFLGLTFPVGEDYCTLVLGGWGGATVGLSSIDGLDAARNATRRLHGFERGRRYQVRLRVTMEEIRVWVDNELWIETPVLGHEYGLRPEVLPSRPLGLSAYATRAALGPLRWRSLGHSTGQAGGAEDA